MNRRMFELVEPIGVIAYSANEPKCNHFLGHVPQSRKALAELKAAATLANLSLGSLDPPHWAASHTPSAPKRLGSVGKAYAGKAA